MSGRAWGRCSLTLQKNVETLSARLILADKVASQDAIVIDAADGALCAYVRAGAEAL